MTHIDDAVLARILDREEVSHDEEEHLRSCGACRARLEALTRWSTIVRRELASMPAPTPPSWDADFLRTMSGAGARIARRRALPRWAWPLMAAALAGVIFAASPAAAWLISGIAEIVRGTPRAEGDASAGIAAPDAGADSGATAVSASIEGELLVIRIAEGRAPGRVVVHATDAELATARLVPGDEGSELTVRPDGFAVAGAAGSVLEVEVPSTLSAVEVWIGELRAARRTVTALRVEAWLFEPGG